ncbi:hypothetical protein CLCR_07682 [Cladophialophora carrionii]|uniref:Uncharacterized protein n=1 Tax=Cladophialophora carrionii TaxID=86049 RepID=A0A1C1CPJ2_9EURO|nr:hypothetical protein CLCR_07682 [Cladophialophora carrionii]
MIVICGGHLSAVYVYDFTNGWLDLGLIVNSLLTHSRDLICPRWPTFLVVVAIHHPISQHVVPLRNDTAPADTKSRAPVGPKPGPDKVVKRTDAGRSASAASKPGSCATNARPPHAYVIATASVAEEASPMVRTATVRRLQDHQWRTHPQTVVV